MSYFNQHSKQAIQLQNPLSNAMKNYVPHLGTIWVCIIKLNSLFSLMRQDAIATLLHAPMAGHHLVTEHVAGTSLCKALSV
jgi:hypothetical protein